MRGGVEVRAEAACGMVRNRRTGVPPWRELKSPHTLVEESLVTVRFASLFSHDGSGRAFGAPLSVASCEWVFSVL